MEIMPERTRIDIFLQNDVSHKYKLEVYFHDIISSCGCKLSTEDASDSSDAILLEVEISINRISDIIVSHNLQAYNISLLSQHALSRNKYENSLYSRNCSEDVYIIP